MQDASTKSTEVCGTQCQDGLSSGLAPLGHSLSHLLLSIYLREYQGPGRSADRRHVCAGIPVRHSRAQKAYFN